MTKGAAEVRALATGIKLDINDLDGRVEFGRHISRIAKTGPILFGNLYHELDALLPIVASKKIDYSLLITRPVKPEYPQPPTLESLSLEPSSSTSPSADALLASALQRYNNDTPPDYARKRSVTRDVSSRLRTKMLTSSRTSDNFSRQLPSIDGYLEEYFDAPHILRMISLPNGVYFLRY